MNEQKNILSLQRKLSGKKRKKSFKKKEDNLSSSDEEFSNENIETERIKKKKKQKDLFRSLSKGLENNNRIFKRKRNHFQKSSAITVKNSS